MTYLSTCQSSWVLLMSIVSIVAKLNPTMSYARAGRRDSDRYARMSSNVEGRISSDVDRVNGTTVEHQVRMHQ